MNNELNIKDSSKKSITKHRNEIKKIIVICLLCLGIILGGCSSNVKDYSSNNTIETEASNEKTSANENDATKSEDLYETIDSATDEKSSDDKYVNVHILDVGQGSSTLIESNNEYMLVDGGDSDKSSYVVSYLNKQGVDELKYVIATHYDSDHLNGVVGALNVFDTDLVISPDYTATSRVYNSFVNIIKEKNIDKVSPKVGKSYSIGAASFTIIAPNGSGYSNVNDYSVGIKLTYMGHSMIIAGDATEVSENEIMTNHIDLKSDVYIVNHHGSSGSSGLNFLRAISPNYAVISAGVGNSYGHPTMKTLEKLRKIDTDIYRTDKQGEIKFSIGNDGIRFDKEPYNNLEAGEKKEGDEHNNQIDQTIKSGQQNTDVAEKKAKYILNSGSKKIHKPSCGSVGLMSESNKIYFDGTIQEAIEQGYEKCKNCFDN